MGDIFPRPFSNENFSHFRNVHKIREINNYIRSRINKSFAYFLFDQNSRKLISKKKEKKTDNYFGGFKIRSRAFLAFLSPNKVLSVAFLKKKAFWLFSRVFALNLHGCLTYGQLSFFPVAVIIFCFFFFLKLKAHKLTAAFFNGSVLSNQIRFPFRLTFLG